MSLLHPRPRAVPTARRTVEPPPPSAPQPDEEALHARRLLLGLYLLLGITVSSWLSRLPSIRESLDLTTGQLGTILLVGAVGSLVTVLGAGAFLGRWGSRVTLVTAAVAYSLAILLMGLSSAAGSVALLTLGITVMSASFGLGNVPLNVESVVIERRMGRTTVPQFHAAFSVGSVAGSLLGAAASWGQVPVVVQFAVVSLVALVWRLRAIPGSVLAAPQEPAGAHRGEVPARRGAGLRESLRAWRERRTLLIGVVVMAAALSEGTANNWMAIAVVDGFAQPEAVAAIVFGVFVASMTAARLAGTWLLDRFGRVPVLAGSGVTSLAGLLAFGLAPNLPLAVAGAVCWGLGAGLAMPIGMAAVSADRLRAAGRVAVVSAFASVSSITAPPLIGLVAEVIGARSAVLLIAVAIVAGIVFSGSVREPAAAAHADPPDEPAEHPDLGDLERDDVVLSGARR